jgi:hypothetical protein
MLRCLRLQINAGVEKDNICAYDDAVACLGRHTRQPLSICPQHAMNCVRLRGVLDVSPFICLRVEQTMMHVLLHAS